MTGKTWWIVAAALFALAGTAHAQYQDWQGPGAAVAASYYDTNFTVGNASYDTHVTKIGFVFGEHFTPDFALFVGGGYASLGMGGNAVAAPFSPTGYYAEAGLHFDPALFSSNFGLAFRIQADYQRVKDTHNSTELVDHWTSWMGAVGPWIRFGQVTLEGGIVYRHASGDQDLSGKINGSEDLGFSRGTNPYIGFTYHPNVDWSIGLHAEGGGRKTMALGIGYHFSPF